MDSKADAQTVKKYEDDKPLTITINDVVYTADRDGMFTVPRVYTETGENIKVLSANVTGLPEKRDDKRTYTYSVLECNADGTKATVADADKLTFTRTVSGGKVTLALSKPLGNESETVNYKLYRSLEGDPELVKQITYEELVKAESNGKTYEVNSGKIIVVPNTAAVRRSVYVTVSGLAKYFGTPDPQHQYVYSVEECDSSGTKVTSSVIEMNVSDGANDTVNLMVSSPAPNLYFKVYKQEGSDARVPVTSGMTVTQGTAGEGGLITANEARDAVLTIKVNDLPAKDSSDNEYSYTIEQCEENGTQIASPTLTSPSQSGSGNKKSLTVTKTFGNVYYKVFRSVDGVTEEQVKNIGENGTKRLKAINNSGSSENDASMVVFTADTNGLIIVSELYADGTHLSVNIPGLPTKDAQNMPYTYTVREYNANGTQVGSGYTFDPDTETDYRTVTVTKELASAIPDKVCFKVKQNGTAIEKLVESTKELKAYKFLVSDQPIDENSLKANADNSVTIKNTLETQDISVALDWNDNGYPQSKTKDMHYAITAGISASESTNAKATVTTVHPTGESPAYEPKNTRQKMTV